VWAASRWPKRKPLRRAARWDGLFPIEMDTPEQLAEMVAETRELRGDDARPFDVAVTHPAGTDLEPWAQAGATWLLTGFSKEPREDEVRAAIEAGP
jgi:hypothetical protein